MGAGEHTKSEGRVKAGGFPAHTNSLKLRIIVDRKTGCAEAGGFPAYTLTHINLQGRVKRIPSSHISVLLLRTFYV